MIPLAGGKLLDVELDNTCHNVSSLLSSQHHIDFDVLIAPLSSEGDWLIDRKDIVGTLGGGFWSQSPALVMKSHFAWKFDTEMNFLDEKCHLYRFKVLHISYMIYCANWCIFETKGLDWLRLLTLSKIIPFQLLEGMPSASMLRKYDNWLSMNNSG